jgi:glycosyltransferase involved in cell wall biosynthesis
MQEPDGSPEPLVSVVVPTVDRPHRLGRLLSALRAQTLRSDSFEVIVVADGASPETLALLARAQHDDGLRIRIAQHDARGGPAAARNTGWRLAAAPLVAFTDDDCVPAPEWLSAALSAARADTVMQGRTEPDPNEVPDHGLFARTLQVRSLGPQYETCNIFYPRAALESLGGFDQGYGLTPGGEDTDLAWRAISAGWHTTFVADALVFHAVEELGVPGMLRVAARWSSTMRVFAEHPQTRSALYRRVFWTRSHYLLTRSMLAMAGPIWLRRLILARHLLELRRRARADGATSWAIPLLLLHDLVECWAVVRGAVRYRTLVV